MRYACLAILAILISLLSGAPGFAQKTAKNILVIFSSANQTSDLGQIEHAMQAHYAGQVNVYVSYIYGNFEQAWAGASYLDSLAETLRRGYSKVKLDLIIVASPDALDFATRYRDKIFPGLPVVFYGLSKDELAEIHLLPGMVGRTESADIQSTVDLALRLHPDTRTIAVIDTTTKLWWALAHAEILRHQDQVKEIDLVGTPSAEMLRSIDSLPPHTVVLFQMAPEGGVERPVDANDVLAEATKRFPTYSAFHTLCLDRGCVGGVYADWNANMAWAGEAAARILSGKQSETAAPVIEDSGRQVMVDWRQLQRWHISGSALPPGSLVLYRPPPLWAVYRKYILAALAVIVIQAFLIAGLLWQRRRKRRAEAILRESEELFRMLAETTPALIWMCGPDGTTTYLNSRRLEYTGGDTTAGFGDTWMEYVHPDDRARVQLDYTNSLRDHAPYSCEYRLRRSDGVYRWVFNLATPRFDGEGSFAGFIGSVVDITDQKLAQQALRDLSGRLIGAQEDERRRIARELHDDICQRLAVLSVRLEQVNRNGSKDSLHDIREYCVEIAADVQGLSHQLHSSKLDHLGLAAALKGFCGEFSKQYSVHIDFKEEGVPRTLPQDVSITLFRITQEALRNAVKYSQSANFAVALSGTAGEILLEVQDWGVGFDLEAVMRSGGLGLLSMQERAHLVRGSLSVESQPGAGTRVLAIVPLTTNRFPETGTEDNPVATAAG
ncbi:sensor histidine kinase [Occallatibacter riparius]|uniref:PAS domain S-box protein n=1 Tax=Occallatibacter riparius TaxID=1002689 RepID=A0A9J7BT26_9BACT|nr:PAS domain S-box protein [Occallatibacter riparius]UWZ86059.1 PAS domain S-box protein [Occallatibacter riparius]